MSAADLAIWRYVTRSVKPYGPRTSVESQPSSEPSNNAGREHACMHRSSAFTYGAPKQLAPISSGAVPDIDRRTGTRFKRGRMAIDDRIDLHGLTLDQAHASLAAFIRRAHAKQARCVIVVTGKGRGGKGEGKIRAELPSWLNQPGLRPLVLAFTEARPGHGGAGAFYVLLKRKRAGQ
ncbi:MAG: Smr/MutS family protein [Rhodospirillaceae bacterium]